MFIELSPMDCHDIADGALQVGAGTGYWAAALRAAGANVLALDIAPPGPAAATANTYHGRIPAVTEVGPGVPSLGWRNARAVKGPAGLSMHWVRQLAFTELTEPQHRVRLLLPSCRCSMAASRRRGGCRGGRCCCATRHLATAWHLTRCASTGAAQELTAGVFGLSSRVCASTAYFASCHLRFSTATVALCQAG